MLAVTTLMRLVLPALVVLSAIACGPPKGGLGSGDDDTATDDGSTPGSGSGDDPGSESGDDPSTTSGATFIPREDLLTDKCDPYAQDCPDGEKCVPFSSSGGGWEGHKCVPIMGEQATGEPCTYGGVVEATDDCDGTGMCWDAIDVDGELVGTCHAFCTGSPATPECPPGSSCSISGGGTVNVCLTNCDPIIQDCNPGFACYFTGGTFNCVFTMQDTPAGQPCGFINDCAAGLACVAAVILPACEGSNCCSPFCALELGDAQCDAVLPGTACVAFFEENWAPPGYEHVGVCVLPEL